MSIGIGIFYFWKPIVYLSVMCKQIQWGSEYRTSLVFKWSKRGQMPNGLVFECHLNTGQPNHLNIRQMDAILFPYPLVWYSNCQSSTDPTFECQTIWNLNFNMFGIQMFLVFNWSVFRSSLNAKPMWWGSVTAKFNNMSKN